MEEERTSKRRCPSGGTRSDGADCSGELNVGDSAPTAAGSAQPAVSQTDYEQWCLRHGMGWAPMGTRQIGPNGGSSGGGPGQGPNGGSSGGGPSQGPNGGSSGGGPRRGPNGGSSGGGPRRGPNGGSSGGGPRRGPNGGSSGGGPRRGPNGGSSGGGPRQGPNGGSSGGGPRQGPNGGSSGGGPRQGPNGGSSGGGSRQGPNGGSSGGGPRPAPNGGTNVGPIRSTRGRPKKDETRPCCYVCGSTFRANVMKKIVGNENRNLRSVLIRHRESHKPPAPDIVNDDRVCQNCYRRALTDISDERERNMCTMTMDVVVRQGDRQCIVCGSDNDLAVLSTEARVNVYIDSGLFVVSSSRCCRVHLKENGSVLSPLCNGLTGITRSISLFPNEVSKFFKVLRTQTREYNKERFNDENSFSIEDFVVLTGITQENFRDMNSFISTQKRVAHTKTYEKRDLICFLVKLRQGLSDDFLKVMFEYTSRQSVSKVIGVVRQALMKSFVPVHLGLAALTRQEYIAKHVTDFATVLYNPTPTELKAIVTVDGTYIYIPKSSNYRVLRQTFSMHKGRHLVKLKMLTAPDGYILDVHGPYFGDGKNNDAACLIDNFRQDRNGLLEWLREGDIFLIDRGYRDALDFLHCIGLDTKMPKYLQGSKQHTSEEANESRLVTKTRWIVEARNGHIKSKFKFFRDIIPMQHVVHIGDFFRIACAILNAYSKPIQMEAATSELARKMLSTSTDPNVLHALIESRGFMTKRSGWIPMTSDCLPSFPRLSEDYLRDLTVGVYQLKLARSYVQDKINKDSEYKYEILLEEPGLVKCQIYSRFRNSVKYNLWIAYVDVTNEPPEDHPESEQPIQGWYCQCKTGARTLGCCAHIASFLWYMGHARYSIDVRYPSNILLSEVQDSAHRDMPIIEDAGTLPCPGPANAPNP